MAWQSTIVGEDTKIVFGDKPYGSFWRQITDAAAGAILAANAPAVPVAVKSDAAKAAQSALAAITADVVTPAPLKDLLAKIVSSLQ